MIDPPIDGAAPHDHETSDGPPRDGGFRQGATAGAADVFTLSSVDFKDGDMLAKKVGDIPSRGPNCKSDNVSPQLAWADPPEGTKSFAFTVFDPDAGYGAGFVHWVAYGIAPDVTSFAEGEIGEPSDQYGAERAARSFPPSAAPVRRRARRTTISSRSSPPRPPIPKGLPPGLTFAELRDKLKGHGAERRLRHRRPIRQSLSVSEGSPPPSRVRMAICVSP